jgi:hypothetical protein
LNQLSSASLTNVPTGLANTLAWSMLVVVGVLLISGPIIVYIYYRKNKRENPVQAVSSA